MPTVALTNIKHNDTWVDAGEEVSQDSFPDITDEEYQALVDSEAIGEPTLTGAEAEAYANERLAEVDALLQEKYNITLQEVLATEDTGGGAEAAVDGTPASSVPEGSSDGV